MKLKRPSTVSGDEIHIHLTRGKAAIIDVVDADLAAFNWYALKAKNTWYAARFAGNERKPTYLHREVARSAGLLARDIEVDHHDLDGLNCRRGNLRAATHQQNNHNTRKNSDNTIGYKGVAFDRRRGTYTARIKAHGKTHHLGSARTAEQAAALYIEAAQRLHGEFARTE